jgi:hypothetical protein
LSAVANPKLKIKATTAQEVCAQYALAPAAEPHLKEGMPPLDFVKALCAGKCYPDAVQFLARALPKREAVWWSCACVREILPPDDQPVLLIGAVQSAEAWVYRPTEENRRKAQQAAKAIQAPHPARWTVQAAFWSGGSMAPPDAPEVKPAEDLTAKAVSNAVIGAATRDPRKVEERYKLFMEYALDIANGGTGRPVAKA